MEPLTILIAIAGIVGTGVLSKIGENITDKAVSKSKELLSQIRHKSPHTAIIIEKAEQQPIDYSQVYLEIDAIAKDDSDIQRLLKEMKVVTLTEPKLVAIVEQELNQATPQLATIIEDWKGINIKGGINTITGNTFQF